MALEQRAAGPTLEGPGADVEAGVYGCVGRPPARCGGGGGGNTEALSGLFQWAERKPGALYSPASGPYWNSQQNNNGPLGVFEKQQCKGSVFFHVNTSGVVFIFYGGDRNQWCELTRTRQ